MTQAASASPARLPWPEAAQPVRYFWPYTTAVILIHVLALAALIPWCFAWSGPIACLVGLYVFGTLGINLGYHRLLTHRGLTTPKWLERSLAILGICCLEDTPARWVAIHRLHHQFADRQNDPHSPLVSFAWAHVTWLFVVNRSHDVVTHYESHVRDLLHDPFYFALEKRFLWLWIYVAHAMLFLAAGLAIGWARTGDYLAGVQFGVSLVVWGVLLRTVLVWHITWSVNSLSHMWGYRNYATKDQSCNNWLVGLVGNGEGWHNNHHWEPRSAVHGRRWWELDVTFATIRLLELLGLARDVYRPRRKVRVP